MKYIVVRPKGELSVVYIKSEDSMIDLPFESWALRDGKQIMFATIKMHRILQSQHFAGSYEQGAMYAYTYEEMCAILTANIGPCDRERYEADFKEESNKTLITGFDKPVKRWIIAYALWKTTVLAVKILIKSLNTVLFLVILPLIISIINRHRK